MASLLVLAMDIPNADKVEGDVISVKDDANTVTTPSGTWHWSKNEDITRWIAEGNPSSLFPGLFYIIDVPGLPLFVAQKLCELHTRPAVAGVDPEADDPDTNNSVVILGPCRWRINIQPGMTGLERAALRNDRRLTVARSRINDIALDRMGGGLLDG